MAAPDSSLRERARTAIGAAKQALHLHLHLHLYRVTAEDIAAIIEREVP